MIRPEFRSYNVVLDDGRILAGLLADSNDSTVTVLDAKNQRTVVKRSTSRRLKVSETSLMPDNVIEPLGEQEIRDLFAYLRASKQAEERGSGRRATRVGSTAERRTCRAANGPIRPCLTPKFAWQKSVKLAKLDLSRGIGIVNDTCKRVVQT